MKLLVAPCPPCLVTGLAVFRHTYPPPSSSEDGESFIENKGCGGRQRGQPARRAALLQRGYEEDMGMRTIPEIAAAQVAKLAGFL